MWLNVVTTGLIGLSWIVYMVLYLLKFRSKVSKSLLHNILVGTSIVQALSTTVFNLVILNMIYTFVLKQHDSLALISNELAQTDET
jgi:hypothetical protein